jgi:hypothetical protein
MRNGHMAWTDAGVVVSGTFMGRDTAFGLAYIRPGTATSASASPPTSGASSRP